MFKTISKLIKEELFLAAQKISKVYVKDVHGDDTDILFIYLEGNQLCYKTNRIKGLIDASEDSWKIMRNNCGQNILLVKSLPKMGEVHKVKLLITPTAIAKIGPVKFYDLFQQWKGQSLVGTLVAIEYL